MPLEQVFFVLQESAEYLYTQASECPWNEEVLQFSGLQRLIPLSPYVYKNICKGFKGTTQKKGTRSKPLPLRISYQSSPMA